jgi:HEAT repeat protein
VYAAAVQLLQSQDDQERELGARILRELGPEDAGVRPFSREAKRELIKRLDVEESPRVIGWIISALGYNNATEELRTILRFAHHEDSFVRFHVAAAIPSLIGGDSPDAEAIATIEEMVTDHDPDVRFYAAYALLEEIGGTSQKRKNEVANSLIDDEDEQIRSFARLWIGESGEGFGRTQ